MRAGIHRVGIALLASAVVALCAQESAGTTIQDLVRIKGLERNVVTGLGIVVGLDGTGDRGKDSLVAARPYAELLKNLGNSVQSLGELTKADTFAIVNVTMEIPATGAWEGDRLDVRVDSLFNAKSLAGGTLMPSVLRLPLPDSPDLVIVAMANGQLKVDPTNARAATVHQGGQMQQTMRMTPVQADGTMRLILKDEFAGYPVAGMIAGIINDEFALSGYSGVARASDPKSIRVILPEADRSDPAPFLSTLMTLYVDPSLLRLPARVVVNEKAGTIVVTGNVEIRSVAVTHNTLTITTITPEAVPTAENPLVTSTGWTGLNTTDRTGRNATQLADLLAALRQLEVPVKDQIAILYELEKTGALHGLIISP